MFYRLFSAWRLSWEKSRACRDSIKNYSLLFYDNDTLLESFTVNFKENTDLFFKTVVNQESKRFSVITNDSAPFPTEFEQSPENYGIKRTEGLMLISGIDMTTNKFIDYPITLQLTNNTTLDNINITTAVNNNDITFFITKHFNDFWV